MSQVDAFEDGGHLARRDFDATIPGLGKAKRAFFQPLVPEREAIAVPIEDLDPVTPAIAEDVEVSRERVLGNPVADELGKAIKRGTILIPLAVRTARMSRS
jgi:hypothetical protein